MSIELLLSVCLIVYLVTIVVELAIRRRVKHFLAELGAVIAIAVLALLVFSDLLDLALFRHDPFVPCDFLARAAVEQRLQ